MCTVSKEEVSSRIDESAVSIEAMGNSERFTVWTFGIGKGLRKQNVWEGTFPSYDRAMIFAEIMVKDHLFGDIEFEKVVVRPD